MLSNGVTNSFFAFASWHVARQRLPPGVLLGSDSLEVCDAAPSSNPRLAYNNRAGYANIDVRLRGKSLVASPAASTDKIVLPKLAFNRHVRHPQL